MPDRVRRDLDVDLDGQASIQPRQARRPAANRPHEPGLRLRAPASHRPVRHRRGVGAEARSRRHLDPGSIPASDTSATQARGHARRGGARLEHAAAWIRGRRLRDRAAQELQPFPRDGPRDRVPGRARRAAHAAVRHGRPQAPCGGAARPHRFGRSGLPARRGQFLEAGEAACPDRDGRRDLPGCAQPAGRPRSAPDGRHPRSRRVGIDRWRRRPARPLPAGGTPAERAAGGGGGCDSRPVRGRRRPALTATWCSPGGEGSDRVW